LSFGIRPVIRQGKNPSSPTKKSSQKDFFSFK
jgi:hypothetical protein